METNFTSYIFNPTEKHLCSGCGACVQACGKKAITMHEDEEGFLYPALNRQECVLCGLCEKTCPIVAKGHFANETEEQKFYMATNTIPSDSKECATIGLCTMLSEWMIKRGGMVFGVILDESDWKSYHIQSDNIKDVWRMRNSKYVQSDTKSTFSEVKEYLKQGREVLYIGTPCEIAGLKGFLKRNYATLYTIDLICHGSYSYKLLQKEVDYWEKLFGGSVSNFRFRSKRKYLWTAGGIINFDLTKAGNTSHIERFAVSSPTYRCFAYSGDGKNYNIRQSCYSCPFREKGRFGDLTVGDAWGLSKKYPTIFSKVHCRSGISSVFANTEKGKHLLECVAEQITLTDIPLSNAFCQSALLPTNREIPAERTIIYNSLDGTTDYGDVISGLFDVNLEREHRRAFMEYKKNMLKSYIKYVLRKWKLYK